MEGIKLLAFAIFVTMLTTPLIRGPEYQLSTGPIVGGWRRTTNFIRYPVRYLGMPIPYCSNSIACFQLAIVLSGDVELNPGPPLVENPLHGLQTEKDSTTGPQRIHYDVSTLHRLNRPPYQMLPRDTWNTICELGVGRHRRTHRGRRALKHPPTTTIQTIIGNRPLPLVNYLMRLE